MNGPHRDDPQPLRVVGATDLEQRLLAAAGTEQPPPELSRRMARGLGIAAGAGLTVAARSATAAGSGPIWPTVWAAVAALAVGGAVVGWARGHGPRAPARAVVAPASALPTVAAAPAPPIAAATADAPRSTPRAHRHRLAAAPADLTAEIALLDAARAALSGGDQARALELLRRYDTDFPSGALRPESTALQVEALARLGRTGAARALGRAFIAAHRDSPLVARVQRVLETAAGPSQ